MWCIIWHVRLSLKFWYSKLQDMESSGLPCILSFNLKKKKKSHILSYYFYILLDPSSHQKWAEKTELRTNKLTPTVNVDPNAITTVCRLPMLVCIAHFKSLQILGVKDQEFGSGGGMDGKKKRLATRRPSAAKPLFQVVIIKISTSMYIKSPGAYSSLIDSLRNGNGCKLMATAVSFNATSCFPPRWGFVLQAGTPAGCFSSGESHPTAEGERSR